MTGESRRPAAEILLRIDERALWEEILNCDKSSIRRDAMRHLNARRSKLSEEIKKELDKAMARFPSEAPKGWH